MNPFINELHAKLGIDKTISQKEVSIMSHNSSKKLVKNEKSESQMEVSVEMTSEKSGASNTLKIIQSPDRIRSCSVRTEQRHVG